MGILTGPTRSASSARSRTVTFCCCRRPPFGPHKSTGYLFDVPLVAAAVCPSPPLLVPELAAGAAGELDDLRAACDAAVARLAEAAPELVVLVGPGATTGPLPPPYRGSFAPWGTPVTVGPADGTALPLGPLLGLWLLDRAGRQPAQVWTVDPDAGPAECAATGRSIAELGAVALLVIGDGAACHGPKSPGYADAGAEPFDDAARRAFADVDTDRLLALDPADAARLRAAGRAPWQVLAGAAAGRGFRGSVHYERPYGVGYLVASWS